MENQQRITSPVSEGTNLSFTPPAYTSRINGAVSSNVGQYQQQRYTQQHQQHQQHQQEQHQHNQEQQEQQEPQQHILPQQQGLATGYCGYMGEMPHQQFTLLTYPQGSLQSPTLKYVSTGAHMQYYNAANGDSCPVYTQSPSTMGMGGDLYVICPICGGCASGTHYGTICCDGCKCFFRRAVLKDLTYVCKIEKKCKIDIYQGTTCPYCRYMKCLAMGMKRYYVHETVGDRILEAEVSVESHGDNHAVLSQPETCQSADNELLELLDWCKHIPHFAARPNGEQLVLLRACWNELLIAAFAQSAIGIKEAIILSSGVAMRSDPVHKACFGAIFDHVITGLVDRMRAMRVDKMELRCLRAIIVLNSTAVGLTSLANVESYRKRIFAVFQKYVMTNYPDEPARFSKLVLCLPALRSISVKCMELLFLNMFGEPPICISNGNAGKSSES